VTEDTEDTTEAPVLSASHEELLKEIRETFAEYCDVWQPVWDQYDLDMAALSIEGPLDPEDRADRKKNNRPCIHIDLLTQNIDQVMGEARQNPRGIECTPADAEADDKTAEMTENRLRAIAYECNANDARLTALETTLRGGFGAWMVRTKYKRGTMEQEFDIERITDPKSVVVYPYCKKADWSDQRRSFKFSEYTHEEFRSKFGKKTQFKTFEAPDVGRSGRFITSKTVIVAEYWKIKEIPGKVYLLDDGSPEGITVTGKELKSIGAKIGAKSVEFPNQKLPTLPILKQREEAEERVCQYLTNGLEILDETEWLGSTIPIIFITGNEKWEKSGRMLDSLIRKARDPQLLYDFACMNEAETLGRIPQAPYIGYKGQMVGDQWKIANKVPLAFLEVELMVDGAPPNVVLPLPQRTEYEPPVQAINLSKTAAQQALQNTMGMTSAERRDRTAKSGKALEQLESQKDVGTFHFFYGYNNGIVYENKILEELLPLIENTPRKVNLIDKQNQSSSVKLMQDTYKTKDGAERPYSFEKGRHTVTLSTGPSHESQRKEAEEFADVLAQQPDIFKVLGPLIIKLRRLGPVGDEMFDILKATLPPEVQAAYNKDKPQSPEVQQVLQQAKQQMDQMNQHAKQLEQKLIELEDAQKAKTAELASKERIAKAQMDLDKEIETLKSETTKYVADLNNRTKALLTHEELTTKENIAEHSANRADASQDRQFEHASMTQDRQLSAEEQARQDAMENQPA
jgi:hypothetical protein